MKLIEDNTKFFGRELAKVVDKVFRDYFKFSAKNKWHREVIAANFFWVGNILYLKAEPEHIKVVEWEAYHWSGEIRFKTISKLTAILLGAALKDKG